MAYNLIEEPWIPVRAPGGERTRIRPWELTRPVGEAAGPPAELDAPRPDFNGALIQFLIGLVQTALGPETEGDWRKGLQRRPSPEKLRAAFQELGPAFDLEGDPPRFMQDHDRIPEASSKPIAYLLVDSPSDYALKENKAHFVKDRSHHRYGPACTAAALYALQTNAPQGGRGHRTSLRGGGPVSTVPVGRDLWHTVWINVLPKTAFRDLGEDGPLKSAIFPWLAPTRTSEDDQAVTPEDAHPFQAYWGLPRRIYLEDPEPEGGRCDLCGRETDRRYARYRTVQHGIKYEGAWEHPLSPHRRSEDGDLTPLHGQQDGFSYRHWQGVAIEGREDLRPARVVRHFYDRATYAELDPVFEGRPRLWVFGFEVDRTKVRAWHESQMPLYQVAETLQEPLERVVAQLVEVASSVANNLIQALRRGLYGYPSATATGQTSWDIEQGASRDHTLFENASVQFWQDTEPAFYGALGRVVEDLEAGRDVEDRKRSWLKTVREAALNLYDQRTQSAQFRAADPKAVAIARQELDRFSSLRVSSMRETLDLPRPEPAET